MLRTGRGIQVGDYWPDLVSGPDLQRKKRMEGLLNHVLKGNSYSTIDSVFSEEGAEIVYNVQASPILDEEKKVIGAVLCAHNISLQTKLQNEAAERALLRTKELEEWNQFYDMLLSVLAHDLRHPFAVMIMKADIIRYKDFEVSKDLIEESFENLRDISIKSIDLLQGLLHWVKSKREDFSYIPESLSVKNVVTEANGLYLFEQGQKGLRVVVDVDDSHRVMAHHQMVLFVCRNLINNATRFAKENGTIHIWSAKM